jgi:hypothetical protein
MNEAEFYFEPVQGDLVKRAGVYVARRAPACMGGSPWISLVGALLPDPPPPAEDDALVRDGKIVARAAAATALHPVRWLRFEEASAPSKDAAKARAFLEQIRQARQPVMEGVREAAEEIRRAREMTPPQMWFALTKSALVGGTLAGEAWQAADFLMLIYYQRFAQQDCACANCAAKTTIAEPTAKGWIVVGALSPSGAPFQAYFCSPAHAVSEDGRNAIAQLSLDARAER